MAGSLLNRWRSEYRNVGPVRTGASVHFTPLPPNRGVPAGPTSQYSRRPAGLLAALGQWLHRLLVTGCLLPLLIACSDDASLQTLRVGVLEYGTVNWELTVIRDRGLARERGIRLELLPMASESAMTEALADDRVDLIVSDWLWAARQRASGQRYQFAPYSLAVGAVMVNPGADIDELADLVDRDLGIAGGRLDKTWLLLRAYADRQASMDLETRVRPRFESPPTVNQMMLDGELPAAINYWHYNARLQALGMSPLITLGELFSELGVATSPPVLGWVFKQDWAEANAPLLRDFLAASFEAKSILAASDMPWQGIRELVKPETRAVFAAIREGYREGIPREYGPAQIEAAEQVFDILAAEAGEELAGELDTLPDDLFWPGFRLP